MKLIPSCSKCPYKLGLVHTLKNPCPQCMQDNYSAYERFTRHDPAAPDGKKEQRREK